jgi:MoxR-like ATPase
MSIEIHDPIVLRPDPSKYVLNKPLIKAVETALRFNQPLLLTGEPGTGKTLLAYRIAYDLYQKTKEAWASEENVCRFAGEPLRFNTKTTSEATDLFYFYDAVSHFQSSNITHQPGEPLRVTSEFIQLNALGKAICRANPKEEYELQFKWKKPALPHSSVVLVDEIDKAPRDFTNDLLNQIEQHEFFVKEQAGYHVELGKENPQRILMILTSNSEKSFPDAFLRRCVFHHIRFPKGEEMMNILKAQLQGELSVKGQDNLGELETLFHEIRDAAVRKKPATAELVALVKLLELEGALQKSNAKPAQWVLDNLSLLVKTREDMKEIKQLLNAKIQ